LKKGNGLKFRKQERFEAFRFDGRGNVPPVFWEYVNLVDRPDREKTPDNAPIKWSCVCGSKEAGGVPAARYSYPVEVGDWIVEPIPPGDMDHGPTHDFRIDGRRILSDEEFRAEFQVDDDAIFEPLRAVVLGATTLAESVRRDLGADLNRVTERTRMLGEQLETELDSLTEYVAPLKNFAVAGEVAAADRDNADADASDFAKMLSIPADVLEADGPSSTISADQVAETAEKLTDAPLEPHGVTGTPESLAAAGMTDETVERLERFDRKMK